MWPFNSYPERTAEDVDDETYDYVIVGGNLRSILLAEYRSFDSDTWFPPAAPAAAS
jgi:hypothetical protein